MSSITGSATSALATARTSVAVSANNVANINTDNFNKSRTVYSEDESGNVKAVIDEVAISSESKEQASNVDLAEEVVSQISSTNLYSANLTAIEVADEMSASIIDIKA